jgi:hypothetical protein
MIKLSINFKVIEDTVRILKSFYDQERVVLWLGGNSGECFYADEVYEPKQIADYDYFEIPEAGMDTLMQKIKSSRKILVAQVHSHPKEAFHSNADDRWAIIRHLNAYSLVIPFFCQDTDVQNFSNHVVCFVLSSENEWIKIDNSNLIIL